MLTPEELKTAQTLKASGKSSTEVMRIIARQRIGGSDPATQPETMPLSMEADLGIGGVKGLAESFKGTMDVAAKIPSQAVPAPFSGAVDRIVQPVKETVQNAIGLSDENLAPDNTTQAVGKIGGTVASLFTPAITGSFARLATRARSAAPIAPGVADEAVASAKGLFGKAKDFIRNPRLALAKQNTEPQFEASAQRLFLDGSSSRIDDPIQTYETYLAQSKKAASDIKEDPALSLVGEKIGDEFRFVIDRRKQAGQVMGEELKTVGKLKTNIEDAFTSFETSLKEADVVYNAVKKTMVPGRASKMTAEDISILEQYTKELNTLGTRPTVAEIDGMISRTKSLVDNFKSARGITQKTNAERLISMNQGVLREQLNPAKSGNAKLANYWKARSLYSELSDFIDEGAGYLGNITQSGDFAKDASLAKSSVQSILNNGKKDWLAKLEELTGYPALDDSVLALQAMKDAGDFRGLSLLETLSQTSPTPSGITQKMIDFAFQKAAQAAAGSPEEQTRIFLNALAEAAQQSTSK